MCVYLCDTALSLIVSVSVCVRLPLIAQCNTISVCRSRLRPAIKWNAEYFTRMFQLEEKDPSMHALPDAALRAYHDNEHVIGKQVATLFENVDILCVPATSDAAFDATLRFPQVHEIDDKEASDYLAWMRIACHISVTGCPSLTLPVGNLDDGRPIAITLVGARGQDAKVLRAAAVLETKLKTELGIDFSRGCPNPRQGSCALDTRGVRTLGEEVAAGENAQLLHDAWLRSYVAGSFTSSSSSSSSS